MWSYKHFCEENFFWKKKIFGQNFEFWPKKVFFQDFMKGVQNALKTRIFVQNCCKNFWKEKNNIIFENRRGILHPAISGRLTHILCLFPDQTLENMVTFACLARKQTNYVDKLAGTKLFYFVLFLNGRFSCQNFF